MSPQKLKHTINVDFHFPSDFNSSGLPHYPHNQYLPLRLLDDHPVEHRDRHSLAEEGYLSGQRRPFRRHGQEGGDNVLFPTILSFAIILLPVVIVCIILGVVFTIFGVGL